MKKITRDLKKHYRHVERAIKDFNIDFSNENWYNGWHQHLDIKGLSDISVKHRKIHLSYYLKLLDKIELLTKDSTKEFQTWIFIDGEWGGYDAIFIHTQNPHSDFPMNFNDGEYNVELPEFLNGLFDSSKYRIGRLNQEYIDDDTNEIKYNQSFIIQKVGLGIMIK